MKLFIIGLFLSFMAHANDEMKKVVFDLTTGELKSFEFRVLSTIPKFKTIYEGRLQELKVAVVIHGDAYKFFVKDIAHSPYKSQKDLLNANDSLKKRISSAVDNYEIDFYMCEAGMKHAKLKASDIYDYVTIIPSSTVGLIDKQNDGYAYIPIR